MAVVTITGAGGFIGGNLAAALSVAAYQVRACVRRLPDPPSHKTPQDVSQEVEYIACPDIADGSHWDEMLHGADAVVHLVSGIGRQTFSDTVCDTEFVQACAKHAVKRLVYISTIKVNGEASGVRPFTADDVPAPTRTAYACYKRAAESAIFAAARDTRLEVTVIRPPLVYGPGVGGNFRALMQSVLKRRCLPFALIQNSRSLVSVFNLCDLIKVCLTHPAAANEVFLVCDGEDLATPELVRLLAGAMRREACLLQCPVMILRVAGALLGQSDKITRLCGDLRVDMTKTRRLLGWQPPVTVAASIERTVNAFLARCLR